MNLSYILIIFNNEIFHLALHKSTGGHLSVKLFCLTLYAIGCLYLYKRKFLNDNEFRAAAIFSPLVAYALLFRAVAWNPQWLIISTPFFALSYFFIKCKKVLIFTELLNMLAFVWIIVNVYPYNVDVIMVNNGPLQSFFPFSDFIMSDFYSDRYLSFFKSLFKITLFAPFLLFVYESSRFGRDIKSTNIGFNSIFLRFLIGITFFLGPVIFCFYKTLMNWMREWTT